MRTFSLIIPVIASSLALQTASAQSGDLFEFFEEEAQVITASRRPQPIRQVPATVYVVRGEDIRKSGVHNLWDALRAVPGVDVMSMRTFYGTVSIRGLNKGFNNRTLILLDGRTVLDGNLDSINWEGLPVLPEEIDRIEVVEGPASALYGANAINGVINIITKSPEQVQGNKVSYAVGPHRTHLGSALHGGQRDKLAYKLGLGWRTTNRFEASKMRASEVGLLHAKGQYALAGGARLELSGGGTRAETNNSLGVVGEAQEEADRGFVRADYLRRHTRLRSFWNRGRGTLKGFTGIPQPGLDYDIHDVNLEHSLVLSSDNNLVVGGGYRSTNFNSNILSTGSVRHHLWSLFFENEWQPEPRWTLWTSGRLDRHPQVGLVFSPRFSMLYALAPAHVMRFSVGTSFRNPTLVENHMKIAQTVDLEDLDPFDVEVRGSTDLDPERMFFLEVAHSGQVGRFKTTAAGFHYRLEDGIAVSEPTVEGSETTGFKVLSPLVNQGETKAWGGEVGVQVPLHEQMSGAVNYSYQHLSGEVDRQAASRGTPNHKINGVLRFRRGRFDLNGSIHWVDRTLWNDNRVLVGAESLEEVESYTLINLHIGYRFGGRLQNLEVGLDAFNALDNDHFETLPELGTMTPGQGGEIIGSRQTLKITYPF